MDLNVDSVGIALQVLLALVPEAAGRVVTRGLARKLVVEVIL